MSTVESLERLAASLSHTSQEGRLNEALAGVPEALRMGSPYHLMLHADLMASERMDTLSHALYQQALTLDPDDDLRRELKGRLFAVLTRLAKRSEAETLRQSLSPETERLSAFGRTLWAYSEGVWHWRLGEVAAFRSTMAEVLASPDHGDRRIAYTQLRAHYALSAAAIDQADIRKAAGQTRSLVDMALRYGFHTNLLSAFGQRLNAELLDQRRLPSLTTFLEVPGEAFDAPTSVARFDFIVTFGIRAIRSGQWALAHSLFTSLISEARRASLRHRYAIATFWLMHCLALQGDMDAARVILAELRTLDAPRRFRDNLMPAWADLMIQTGRFADAVEALHQVDDGALSDDDRSRVRLYRLAAAMPAEAAGEKLREILARPDSERAKSLHADVLRRVGLSDDPPPLCLKLLGQPSLQLGVAAIEFPRRKILSLLALLALYPEGLTSNELVAKLFPESDDLEPQVTLRKTVYQARQVLKALNAPDPIEHGKGGYRLRRECVDLLDIHEFELLHHKALELEATGHRQGAMIYHRFVAWMGECLPFDGLPETCFAEPRERLMAMLERSHAFLCKNDGSPQVPGLAWSDAWRALDENVPSLADRMRGAPAVWATGDEVAARAKLDALLTETFIGNRVTRIAHGLVLVLRCLMDLSAPSSEMLAWTERLHEHARRHPGETDHLMVHAIGLHSRILDEGGHLPLQALLEAPTDWSAYTDAVPWVLYAATFGHYLLRVGRPELASRVFTRLRASASGSGRPELDEWLAQGETLFRAQAGGPRRDPHIRMLWFGEPTVICDGEAIRFPRKKSLALLALLALHPAGLGVDTLFSLLYPETRHSNAKKTIYTLVATTRQALEAHGAANLIESLPGLYRLRAHAVAHCDQQAFDLLSAKGGDLDRLGHADAARFYHQLAADLAARGPLYAGLNEDCFEALRTARSVVTAD